MTGLEALPLSMAGEGERVRILDMAGGRFSEKRLIDLGLVVGRELVVVHRQTRGALVVALGDTRLALGFGLAQKVLVTPVTTEAAR